MVSYGGGANSTALLIGLHQHRIPVDLILFADFLNLCHKSFLQSNQLYGGLPDA